MVLANAMAANGHIITSVIKTKVHCKASIQYKPLVPADLLKDEIPQTQSSIHTVEQGRIEIADIIHQRDDRLLVVVGPGSFQDPHSTLLYANLLHLAAIRFSPMLRIVLRCNAEKPPTAQGWKGFINDPHLDGTFDINYGLRLVRQLFVDITDVGLPLSTELLGALSPHYLADLMSVGAIGPRTVESPLHRELASSVPFPVGFVDASRGELGSAVEAIAAASTEHHFISVTPQGRSAIAWTPGNDNCFAILKSGLLLNGIQSIKVCVRDAIEELRKAAENPVVVVDCSQEGRGPEHQLRVIDEVCKQLIAGGRGIVGVMLESNLLGRGPSGSQRMQCTSTCDEDEDCLGWEATMLALEDIAAAVCQRRGSGRARGL